MNPIDAVKQLLGERNTAPYIECATCFAPANIALCKYWGKRNEALNLPVTSSLSIGLQDKGTRTTVSVTQKTQDQIVLNQQAVSPDSEFAKRMVNFLDLFRNKNKFLIETENNIPTKAGLASSASGFAALTRALNQLFHWQLDDRALSILARLGSGSACRSLWPGFVKWYCGEREDGSDSVAKPLNETWPDLSIGLLLISDKEKSISSREAMQRTKETSLFYKLWPKKVEKDLASLERALRRKDFDLLGRTAESNALAMHAAMLTAHPPIVYFEPQTIEMMHQIWRLRQEGHAIYFTQDAGPNLKLLFCDKDEQKIQSSFPDVEIVHPFKHEK